MSPSSKSRLAPYWTTKQSLANSLVQFGCVGHQTPKSKVNGPRVHFPYMQHQNTNTILNSTFFIHSWLSKQSNHSSTTLSSWWTIKSHDPASTLSQTAFSIQHIPDQQAVVELVDVVAEVYLGEDGLELELTSNQKKLQNQQIQEI